jgi:hypothetical protein
VRRRRRDWLAGHDALAPVSVSFPGVLVITRDRGDLQPAAQECTAAVSQMDGDGSSVLGNGTVSVNGAPPDVAAVGTISIVEYLQQDSVGTHEPSLERGDGAGRAVLGAVDQRMQAVVVVVEREFMVLDDRSVAAPGGQYRDRSRRLGNASRYPVSSPRQKSTADAWFVSRAGTQPRRLRRRIAVASLASSSSPFP